MKRHLTSTALLSAVTFLAAGVGQARAFQVNLIQNGSFEAGPGGITTPDPSAQFWSNPVQGGSNGMFSRLSGTSALLSGTTIPAPPDGIYAEISDNSDVGSHLLYQDIVVPTNVTGATLSFALLVDNHSTGGFQAPSSLDYNTPLNQQARVDFITTGANLFSVANNDVLLNVDSPTSNSSGAYVPFSTDVTSLLAAHPGETLRLRFAVVANVDTFVFGVDNVKLIVQTNAVPEPASLTLLGVGALALVGASRLRRWRAVG